MRAYEITNQIYLFSNNMVFVTWLNLLLRDAATNPKICVFFTINCHMREVKVKGKLSL
jgi:hypothetical protein